MEEPANFFSRDIQDGGKDGNRPFDSPYMKDSSNYYLDASPGANLDHPSIDPLSAQTHQLNQLPMDSIYVQPSRKTANRRAKSQSTIPQFNPASSESPGLSSGSSDTPESHSSQHTVTPEDRSGVHGFLSGESPPSKRRKQRGKKDMDEGIETAKRDRFLEKNRVAATKCRQKKKEWVSDLEETRFGLESQNNHLQMEYSSLRNEITQIKSQLMEHASCNDPNIDKWIENEAKRFVVGAGERYDQMLANLGHAPGLVNRHESFSSASGYPTVPDSELISPVTSSHRGSMSFPPGTMMPNSPVLCRPDLTPSMPEAMAPVPAEEPFSTGHMHNPMPEDIAGFDGISMGNDAFQSSAMPEC
ncbi:uncharacterized protein GGS22DRAFT_197128 [Annulohypoxylon maeteangense]|uniref:uncharacterized protein n=1 Tax=Annulohypoxylon maeteangense TaxID=1927788 RepID=UPI0020076C45|nr:uncharacterized protein GGS22DRAFT_197128 [Annulohypoxylon maeteangense]KAI0881040.1 hypothetical protein GGS22DRAFT_197128 [Annulohypoxylon maeteangense]